MRPWNFSAANLGAIIPQAALEGTNVFGLPPALGISASSTGSVRVEKVTNSRIEKAPFTVADIEPILSLLSRCPQEVSMSRVFRQHGVLGTCWYDSLIIMLFENQRLKPYIMPFVDAAFRIYVANDILDLSYATVRVKTNAEKATDREAFENYKQYGIVRRNAEYIEEPILISTNYKLNLLAYTFQRITSSPPEIELKHWQFFANAIQRYMLLGYLFHKHPEERNKPLRARRQSYNTISFESVHGEMRGKIGAVFCGADNRVIKNVIVEFTNLINFVGKGAMSIIPFVPEKAPGAGAARPFWAPTIPENWWKQTNIAKEKIEGYYIVINRKDNPKLGHVISLYKCGDQWTIFDNDHGILVLSPDESANISGKGIKSVDYTYLPPENNTYKGNIQYTITLEDDTVIIHNKQLLDIEKTVEAPREYIFDKVGSYKLISRAAAAGGRRKTRKHKKQVSRKRDRN
jgi:hypothetical protein